MFAGIVKRVERLARARAAARGRALAALLAEAGVTAAAAEGGVRLSGNRLRRRIARDARLRALIGGAAR
ncbi:MAG TPA: hypothetical protein VGW40_02390 [Allosphingosinicella sp.]|nr:hypothetical protein [Allosphingosinicella sp.]